MRLIRTSRGTRVALLVVSVLLVMGTFVVPATAAHRNQFIRTDQLFERGTAGNTSNSDCASGTFEATGVITATGNARSCAREFSKPAFVRGTTQLHNGDDLTLNWRVQCIDPDGRARRFECTGQWSAAGPTWKGGGDARLILDFFEGPFGSADFTFTGNLSRA